jgi:hypothetical protein
MKLKEVVLLGIVSILGNPDWENACVGEALELHKSDPARFEDRVKLLTKKYALKNEPDENKNIKEIQRVVLGGSSYI